MQTRHDSALFSQRDWLLLLFLALDSAPRGLDRRDVYEGLTVLRQAADLPRDGTGAPEAASCPAVKTDLEALVAEGLVQDCPDPRTGRRATPLGIARALELVEPAGTASPRALNRLYDMKRAGRIDEPDCVVGEDPGRARPGGLVPRSRRLLMRVARRFAKLILERELDTAEVLIEAHHFHPERTRYRASGWTLLGRVIDRHEVGRSDVFVDFGSGKGRVVYQAARYPFARVVGVEISPELNRIAEENIERNRSKLACEDVELITADLVVFEVPDDMTIAYFFLPVTGASFRRAVENVIASLDRQPRRVKLIYAYPFAHPGAADGERHLRSTGRFEATPETLRNAYDDDENRVAVYVSHAAAG